MRQAVDLLKRNDYSPTEQYRLGALGARGHEIELNVPINMMPVVQKRMDVISILTGP